VGGVFKNETKKTLGNTPRGLPLKVVKEDINSLVEGRGEETPGSGKGKFLKHPKEERLRRASKRKKKFLG